MSMEMATDRPREAAPGAGCGASSGAGSGAVAARGLGWLGVARLGLVQALLGGVVVLTTSTLNRVMVVELALPALLPGLLVALHYAVQLTRPRMGYGADRTARRTPWIIGGMVVLAVSGWLAAVATAWMSRDATLAIALATLAFAGVGLGVSAAGTSLLVLLAKQVPPRRRAPLRRCVRSEAARRCR